MPRRGKAHAPHAPASPGARAWAIMNARPATTTIVDSSMFWKKKHAKHSPPDNPLARRVVRGDDRPTQPLETGATGLRQAPTDPPGVTGADETTRLITPPRADSNPFAENPPVAVLLIVAGPGKGRLLAVGYGMNSLGRDRGERICMDFGDERISRRGHALLTYDERGGRFFLQHGGGASLTYHGDAPVLEPVTLADGDRITLGDTQLLFRALVGDDFDWSETPASAPAP